MRSTIFAAAAAACVAATSPAFAQQAPPPQTLPIFIVDARGAFASLGADETTAEALGITVERLPRRALALSGGAHVYPFRRPGFAIGVGAEVILSRATTQGGTDINGVVTPRVDRRLTGVAGVLSLNFGGRDGWSYLSGGAGPLRFESTSSLIPSGTAPATTTLNAGGGARWFVRSHLAAGFDVRVYLTRPAPSLADSAGRDRARLLVVSIGVSLR
jgi:hypothetical protein